MPQTNSNHAKDRLCTRTCRSQKDITAVSSQHNKIPSASCVWHLVEQSFCYVKLPYWVNHYRRFEQSWFLLLHGLRCLKFVPGQGRQHFGGTAHPVPSVMSQRKCSYGNFQCLCLLRVSAVLTVMMLNCNSTSSCTTWGSNGCVHQDFSSV